MYSSFNAYMSMHTQLGHESELRVKVHTYFCIGN